MIRSRLINLKAHFNAADIERIRLRSSKSARYAQLANITNQANNVSFKLNAPQPPHSAANSSPQYCWSHGLIAVPHENPHNSQTCRSRLPGHCEEATLLNMMGGCNLIRGSRTRMIWKCPDKSTSPTDHANPGIAVPI
jgi:putative hemolysin